MRGWRIDSSCLRRDGSAKTIRASSARRREPSAAITCGPNAETISPKAGWPGKATSRARSSVSITGRPRSRRSLAEVDLPIAIPPVSPISFTGALLLNSAVKAIAADGGRFLEDRRTSGIDRGAAYCDPILEVGGALNHKVVPDRAVKGTLEPSGDDLRRMKVDQVRNRTRGGDIEAPTTSQIAQIAKSIIADKQRPGAIWIDAIKARKGFPEWPGRSGCREEVSVLPIGIRGFISAAGD